MKYSFVYIMSNKNRTVLYIGVTNNIEERVKQHKSGCGSAFTKKYNATELLYFEKILRFDLAIDREKQLKNWHKEWKWNLIKTDNPELKDQAAEWFTEEELKEYCKQFVASEQFTNSGEILKQVQDDIATHNKIQILKQVQDDVTQNIRN
jgi:putative endonuclease